MFPVRKAYINKQLNLIGSVSTSQLYVKICDLLCNWVQFEYLRIENTIYVNDINTTYNRTSCLTFQSQIILCRWLKLFSRFYYCLLNFQLLLDYSRISQVAAQQESYWWSWSDCTKNGQSEQKTNPCQLFETFASELR